MKYRRLLFLLLLLPTASQALITIDFSGFADVTENGTTTPESFTGWLVYDPTQAMIEDEHVPPGVYWDSFIDYRIDIGNDVIAHNPNEGRNGAVFIDNGQRDGVTLNYGLAFRNGHNDTGGEWYFGFWGPAGDVVDDLSLANLSDAFALPNNYIAFDSYTEQYDFSGRFTAFGNRQPTPVQVRDPADSPVPEPSTVFLLGTGAIGYFLKRLVMRKQVKTL